jgi:hypothetical protein
MNTIDLGIIKFEPHANAADVSTLTAAVDELEMYVSVSRGRSGFWIIDIDGDFVVDEYTDEYSAAVAALGHLIVRAVDVTMDAAEPVELAPYEQGRLCRRWLGKLVGKLSRPETVPE